MSQGITDLKYSINLNIEKFCSKMKASTSAKDNSVSQDMENFSEFFLNKLYGLSLINANTIRMNIDTVDLIDPEAKIAYQITNNDTKQKLKEAIIGFYRNDWCEKGYDKFKILILVYKKDSDLTAKDKKNILNILKIDILPFTYEILDGSDLYQEIINIDYLRKLNSLLAILQEYTGSFSMEKDNVARTFQDLFRCLSSTDCPSFSINIDEQVRVRDPGLKLDLFTIAKRDLLEKNYVYLSRKFSEIYKEVKLRFGLTDGSVNDIIYTLQSVSQNFLLDSVNDYDLAYSKTLNYFYNVAEKSNSDYNKLSVDFFILENLLNCNVLPIQKNIDYFIC